MRTMNIAATGMLAQQLNVEVISNNIANMNTTGYKRQRAEFQDLIYQTERRAGTETSDQGTVVPAGVQVGLGVKAAAVYRIHQQGNLVKTDNALDLAIEGRGFFQVEMPDGTYAYTRAGSLQLSPDGEIVTTDGYRIAPGITIPVEATDIMINPNGQVFVKLPGEQQPQPAGTLELAIFANEGGLDAMGSNLFRETPASGAPQTGTPGIDSFGTIRQGFLETSNVNPVSEITNLISAQRAYEMNSKVVQAADEMSRTVTNMR